jgi:hypothetical protein
VVYELCDEFDQYLDRPVITPAPRREAFTSGVAA